MPSMTTRAKRIRATIHKCIQDRLAAKLGDLDAQSEKRERLEAAHDPDVWLADAARRVRRIGRATHILKPIHPKAQGTNLHVSQIAPPGDGLLGTGSLKEVRWDDVFVDDAAALDVYTAFLSVEFEGQPLWRLAQCDDGDFVAALSDDFQSATAWQQAFAEFAGGGSDPTSHTLAKQIYFPVSEDRYHLLAPLFPTSLVHEAHVSMHEDRFGEAAKQARQARSNGEHCAHGYREYPGLAIRKFGGSQPQNVSQLNSKRHGDNWLLASLPPQWESADIRPPLGADSIFPVWFGGQRAVRELTRGLRHFLETTPGNNVAIRERRATFVREICEEVLQYSARIRQLAPGWSADPRCRLDASERYWLDAGRGGEDLEFRQDRQSSDWEEQVSHRFANWINSVLSDGRLTFGEDEHRRWKSDLEGELRFLRDELEATRG